MTANEGILAIYLLAQPVQDPTLDLEVLPEASMTPETKLKGEVQDFLTVYGMFWMRLQSGMVKVRGAWMHLCPTGTADLVVYPNKGFGVGWIEMKTLKGTQRASQVEFQAKAKAAGHPYLIARSVSDVEKWLKENEAI